MSIELLPEQLTFMQSTKPIVCYVGGIGAGKSFIACIKAVKNAMLGRSQMMVGLTFGSSRDVLLTTIKIVLNMYGLIDGVHYKINDTRLEVTLKNGTKIFIKSSELGKKLRGYSVSDIYIDEAAFLKDRTLFDILLGRMRENKDAQIHLTTSPNSFNWVYEITKLEDCEYIKVSTFKNSFLEDSYLRLMAKNYPSALIKQELYADFINITSGLFDSQWIKNSNTDSTLQSQYSKVKRIRFWDLAFTENGDYSAGVLLAKVGHNYVIEDIVRVKKTYTNLKKVIIDTAIADGTSVTIGLEQAGQQVAVIDDVYKESKLHGHIKKKLSVAKYGHKMKRILPLSSLAENGMLFISPTCKHHNDFKSECDALTMDDTHMNDDMVDACASAYIMFNNTTSMKFGSR